MRRLLVGVVLLFAVGGCRMNFDPVDELGDEYVQIGGSYALVADPGSDFYTVCTPGEPCEVDCTAAASCIVECNGASSCDVACTADQCIVELCLPPACNVDCGAGTLVSLATNTFCD